MYAYLRRIDEARKFKKIMPFDDGVASNKIYRLDYQNPVKGISTLDIIWSKWIKFDKPTCDQNNDGTVDNSGL